MSQQMCVPYLCISVRSLRSRHRRCVAVKAKTDASVLPTSDVERIDACAPVLYNVVDIVTNWSTNTTILVTLVEHGEVYKLWVLQEQDQVDDCLFRSQGLHNDCAAQTVADAQSS